MITVNMKMSIKTSITIVIVIVNNVTYNIIIIMDGAHISLISAGISLSCGKGRMDKELCFKHKHDRCFVDNDISVYEI